MSLRGLFSGLPPGAILDRLCQVSRLDPFAARQVSDGAGQLEDAVIGPGAHAQLLHGRFEQGLARSVHRAELAHLGGSHVGVALQRGVAVGFHSCKACPLSLPGCFHPVADGRAWLAQAVVGQLVVLDAGHLDVNVDAVQQRPRDTLLVAADHAEGAGALVDRVAVIAAGAGVHRGDEHEIGRKREGAGGAGDGDDVIFHRLAQHL